MKQIFLLFLYSNFLFCSCCLLDKDIPSSQIAEIYGNRADGSQFMQLDDILVHYRDQGEGPVIVALHGICDSLHTWDGWYEILKNDFRFIRLDLPGFGLTGRVPPEYYSSDKYLEVLEKFLASLDVNEYVLVGNSLGGYFSWQFALQHGMSVKKLILIDPAGYPLNLPWIVKMVDSQMLSWLFYRIAPKFLTRSVVRSVYGDKTKAKESDVARFHEIMLMENNRKAYLEVFQQIIKLSKVPPVGISDLTMPVLLMWGEGDHWIAPDQVALWQRDLPGIKVILYNGVGHVPQMEIPVQSARDAKKFILSITTDN